MPPPRLPGEPAGGQAAAEGGAVQGEVAAAAHRHDAEGGCTPVAANRVVIALDGDGAGHHGQPGGAIGRVVHIRQGDVRGQGDRVEPAAASVTVGGAARVVVVGIDDRFRQGTVAVVCNGAAAVIDDDTRYRGCTQARPTGQGQQQRRPRQSQPQPSSPAPLCPPPQPLQAPIPETEAAEQVCAPPGHQPRQGRLLSHFCQRLAPGRVHFVPARVLGRRLHQVSPLL